MKTVRAACKIGACEPFCGLETSRKYPGVNVNLVHDDQVRDAFTGMPVYNGTPCRVGPVTG